MSKFTTLLFLSLFTVVAFAHPLQAMPVKKPTYPCTPGDVYLPENLICEEDGKNNPAIWANRTKYPRNCKENDSVVDERGKYMTCHVVRGEGNWIPDDVKNKRIVDHAHMGILYMRGKHLVRKFETYEGTRPVVYESSLPEPYRISTPEEIFMADPTSDTLVIVPDENGDILAADYGRVKGPGYEENSSHNANPDDGQAIQNPAQSSTAQNPVRK